VLLLFRHGRKAGGGPASSDVTNGHLRKKQIKAAEPPPPTDCLK
jgi:hypothetical protein